MSGLREAISGFLEGFGPGFLFADPPRRGAATQVFATEDVPCDPLIEETADAFLTENRVPPATRSMIHDAVKQAAMIAINRELGSRLWKD